MWGPVVLQGRVNVHSCYVKTVVCRCTLLKRAWYHQSIGRVRVRLCVGQDQSPVSSGQREEVQSPISPTSDTQSIYM
jgi:hypothetical protein